MLENPSLVSAAVTVLVSAVSAVGTWLVTRSKGRIDIQGSINTGFDLLTKRLTEERDKAVERADRHLAEIDSLRQRLEEHEERLDRQRRHIDALVALLRQHGIVPPSGIAET